MMGPLRHPKAPLPLKPSDIAPHPLSLYLLQSSNLALLSMQGDNQPAETFSPWVPEQGRLAVLEYFHNIVI